MAGPIFADLVEEYTSTAGSGNLELAGAVNLNRRAVSSEMTNGDWGYFYIRGGTAGEWEVSKCTYTTSGNYLTRNTVYKSSNGNATVDFSGSEVVVRLVAPANWFTDRSTPSPVISSPAYASTITADASSGAPLCIRVGALTDNITLGNPTSPVNGQRIEYRLKQDGTGGRTLTLGNKFRLPLNVSGSIINLAANSVSTICFEYDAVDDKFDLLQTSAAPTQSDVDSKLPLAGGTMAGNIDLDGNKLSNPRTITTPSSVIIFPSDSATDNGVALLAALVEAKALTPNGAALSATNRASLMLFPGRYALATDTEIALDTQFVDLVGVGDRTLAVIQGMFVTGGLGTIRQSADNIHISNVTLRATGGDANAYLAEGQYSSCNMSDVLVSQGGLSFPSHCDGTYTRVDVSAASMLFGRYGQNFLGNYKSCSAPAGFGINANASGTFTDCSAPDGASFGSNGTASGAFTRCVGGLISFGGASSGGTGSAQGTFVDCQGGPASFGGVYDTGTGTAYGTFIRCTGGVWSFGGNGGTLGGELNDCTYANQEWGGTFLGLMDGCRWEVAGTNKTALMVDNYAVVRNSVLLGTGTGKSIDAGSAVSIEMSGCILNKGVGSNVTITDNFSLKNVALTSGKLSQFAATTSSELAGVISDETGTGALVFADSPTLVTPSLGAATATSINGNTITAGTGTLTLGASYITMNDGFDGAGSAGSISTYGGSATGTSGGVINTGGGTSPGAYGGPINTAGGSLPGGDVVTSDGGGSINTRGTGSIGMGVSGTRTIFTGTATADRAIALPDADGTVALQSYVDGKVAGLLNYKGVTDCSATPNYPTAVKGDAYLVSVAGKIGGASGTSVDAGDWFVALADNAGGTEASVGSSWGHMEHNLPTLGALATVTPGTGVATFLTTPSSANLAAAVTDETGTGALVFANTPTLVTPNLGAATATSLTCPPNAQTYAGERFGKNAAPSVNAAAIGTTAIGQDAGYNLTTGSHNTLIGFQVGAGLTTGSSNVVIGSQVSIPAGADSAIVIGRSISYTAGNRAIAIGVAVDIAFSDVIAIGVFAKPTKDGQFITGRNTSAWTMQHITNLYDRPVAEFQRGWSNSTDATRMGWMSMNAYDAAGLREGIRVGTDGSQALIGVFGAPPVAKQTVTGSRGSNAALASLLTALANLGFITDSSS